MSLRVSLRPTGNRKLVGDNKSLKFFATYREVGSSCPETCVLLNNGCYAQTGHVFLQMRGRISENDGKVFLAALERMPQGAIMRLHVSGDVMIGGDENGSNTVDTDYLDALIQGAKNRPDMEFYGYTHAWRLIDPSRFPDNLTMNASCENENDVAEARRLGWDTVIVLPHDVVGKRFGSTVVCPNQTQGLTCDTCRLCFKSGRSLTVGFKAHGQGKYKVTKGL